MFLVCLWHFHGSDADPLKVLLASEITQSSSTSTAVWAGSVGDRLVCCCSLISCLWMVSVLGMWGLTSLKPNKNATWSCWVDTQSFIGFKQMCSQRLWLSPLRIFVWVLSVLLVFYFVSLSYLRWSCCCFWLIIMREPRPCWFLASSYECSLASSATSRISFCARLAHMPCPVPSEVLAATSQQTLAFCFVFAT